jgi:hypothetical protein
MHPLSDFSLLPSRGLVNRSGSVDHVGEPHFRRNAYRCEVSQTGLEPWSGKQYSNLE